MSTTPDYGIDVDAAAGYTTNTDEQALFSEIDDALRVATKRQTYQPYFEMMQTGASNKYFSQLDSIGQTSQGIASGFSSSGKQNMQSDAIQQEFGEHMVKVEDEVNKKMSSASATINDIIQSNRQTALTLRQMKENQDDGSSCFKAGTLILMSDGTEKVIENVNVGDKVIGNTGDVNTVTYIQRNPLGNRYLYGFGKEQWFTGEHPFLTAEGWKSLDPEFTRKENPSFKDLKEMQVGDKLFIGSKVGDKVGYFHCPIVMLSVDEDSKEEIVYNLLTDGNNTYHANSFVVHSIQPSYDADFVSNGIKNLSKKQKDTLFNAVKSSKDPQATLDVLGAAWGISVPKAFKEMMSNG